MDGTVRFNTAFYPTDTGFAQTASFAEDTIQKQSRQRRKVFISHKTNDVHAENLAKYITRKHRVITYLAEWDPNVHADSPTLPDYIMRHIRTSQGFLVSVRPQIAISMWVGYEIGGAHAYSVPRAKIMFTRATGLPSVVEALPPLANHDELDVWIAKEVSRARHA